MDRMRNQADEALARTGPNEAAVQLLTAVADHLTTVQPGAPFPPAAQLARINATAYALWEDDLKADDLHDRIRAALAIAPELRPGTTRGEYALQLRQAAGKAA